MSLHKHIGYRTPAVAVVVDPWRVRLFCQAVGETNPVYTDPDAARAQGHPGCPVPPTFLKALEGDGYSSARLLQDLGVPMDRVLHAEQRFDLHHPVHVGDRLLIERAVTAVQDKKGGALTFVTVDTTYRRDHHTLAQSQQTILVKNTPHA